MGGKTAGRAIDYNSKIAQKYKLQLEEDTAATLKHLHIGSHAQEPVADPVDAAADSTNPKTTNLKQAAPVGPAVPASAPVKEQKPVAASNTYVIRKAEPPPGGYPTVSAAPAPSTVVSDLDLLIESSNSLSSSVTAAQAPAPTTATVKKNPQAAEPVKPKAKELDIDFD